MASLILLVCTGHVCYLLSLAASSRLVCYRRMTWGQHKDSQNRLRSHSFSAHAQHSLYGFSSSIDFIPTYFKLTISPEFYSRILILSY